MLRYKTETRPGLVALYDIRPGNGAGPFLQPRSPHRAQFISTIKHYFNTKILMLVIKYLLRVFKYLTIAYNNHTVKNMHCH